MKDPEASEIRHARSHISDQVGPMRSLLLQCCCRHGVVGRLEQKNLFESSPLFEYLGAVLVPRLLLTSTV
jgi:hypothetical protein